MHFVFVHKKFISFQPKCISEVHFSSICCCYFELSRYFVYFMVFAYKVFIHLHSTPVLQCIFSAFLHNFKLFGYFVYFLGCWGFHLFYGVRILRFCSFSFGCLHTKCFFIFIQYQFCSTFYCIFLKL